MVKQSIQEKIDDIRKRATAPVPVRPNVNAEPRHVNDSLAKVIRTQADADRFMIELEVATAMAKKAEERRKKAS